MADTESGINVVVRYVALFARDSLNIDSLEAELKGSERIRLVRHDSFKGVKIRTDPNDVSLPLSNAFIDGLKNMISTEQVNVRNSIESAQKQAAATEAAEEVNETAADKKAKKKSIKSKQEDNEANAAKDALFRDANDQPIEMMFVLLRNVVSSLNDMIQLHDCGVDVLTIAEFYASSSSQNDAVSQVSSIVHPMAKSIISVTAKNEALRDVDLISFEIGKFNAEKNETQESVIRNGLMIMEMKRVAYEKWKKGVPIITVGVSSVDEITDMKLYDSLLGERQNPSVAQMIACLYRQVDQSIRDNGKDSIAIESNQLLAPFEAAQLAVDTNQCDLSSHTTTESPLIIVDYVDHETNRNVREVLSSIQPQLRSDDVWLSIQDEAAAIEKRAVPMPNKSIGDHEIISREDRSMQYTAILSHSSLPLSIMSHAHRLRVLEDIMRNKFGKSTEIDRNAPCQTWNFSLRQYREYLSSKLLYSNYYHSTLETPLTCVESAYSGWNDEIVMVVHTHTPFMRCDERLWDFHMIPDQRLHQWNEQKYKNTKPTCLYGLGSDQLSVGDVSSESRMYFCADQTIIGQDHITIDDKQRNSRVWALTSNGVYTSLQKHQDAYSLRATFDEADGATRLSIYGAFIELCDPITGIIARLNTNDASISLQHPKTDVLRIVLASGAVLVKKRFVNGSMTVLHPNGEVAQYVSGKWTITNAQGHRFEQTKTDKQTTMKRLDSIHIVKQTDPESNCQVITREDDVFCFIYSTGEIKSILQHADGTRFTCRKDGRTSIEIPHWGKVWVRGTCKSKYEDPFDTIVTLNNGASIIYNTKYGVSTVKVCAYSLKVKYPYFQYAPDASRCIFIPYAEPPLNIADDWMKSDTPITGCYQFDLKRGVISTIDLEENKFRIGIEQVPNVELSMLKNNVVPPPNTIANVNNDDKDNDELIVMKPDTIPVWYYSPPSNPLQPRVFILNRESAQGFELLRNDDVEWFERRTDPSFISNSTKLPLEDVLNTGEDASPQSCKTLITLQRTRLYNERVYVPNIVKAGIGLPIPLEEQIASIGVQYLVYRELRKHCVLNGDTLERARIDMDKYHDDVKQQMNRDKEFDHSTIEHVDPALLLVQREIENDLRQRRMGIENELKARELKHSKHSAMMINRRSSQGRNNPNQSKQRKSKLRPVRAGGRKTRPIFVHYFTENGGNLSFAIEQILLKSSLFSASSTSNENVDQNRVVFIDTLTDFSICLEFVAASHLQSDSVHDDFDVDCEQPLFRDVFAKSSFILENDLLKYLFNALGFVNVSPTRYRADASLLYKIVEIAIPQFKQTIENMRLRLSKSQTSDNKEMIQHESTLPQNENDLITVPGNEMTSRDVLHSQGGESSQAVDINTMFAQQEHEYYQSNWRHSHETSSLTTRAAYVDVCGELRDKKVVPIGITYAHKAMSIPNIDYLAREADTCTGGSHLLGDISVQPSRANYGLLEQGGVYRFKLVLTNTGVESTRFRVQAISTNPIYDPIHVDAIRLMYRPGPLAPGMRIRLEIELDTSITLAGNLSNRLWFIEVSCESRVVRVPICGLVMPNHEDYAQAVAALEWKHYNKNGKFVHPFSAISKLVRIVRDPPNVAHTNMQEGSIVQPAL